MSSLPFISHHLFVAAARQDERARRKPSRREPPPRARDSVDDLVLARLRHFGPGELPPTEAYRLALLLGDT
jgi:hypothetical protein